MQKEKKLKLLIVTQSIDVNNPVLGFFHRWVEEFAKHADQVTVIALGVGEYHLPDNVRVFSLGKEKKRNLLQKLFTFYLLLFTLRKEYDTVFVHMNQEYVLLGGLLWKLLGKKITMWRNHPAGSLLTRVAMLFSDKLFCTSKYSFTAQSKKTVLMPAGIDTETFRRDDKIPRIPNSILFLGRIAPVKNVDVFIDALGILDKSGVAFEASIYGDSTEKDKEYYEKIKTCAMELEKKGRIIFYGGVPNTKTPSIYNQYELFVNATPSGSFDKTILEAMACETLVLTSNLNLNGQINDTLLFKENSVSDLAEKLKAILNLDTEAQKKYGKILRNYVVEKQSLSLLMNQMQAALKEI